MIAWVFNVHLSLLITCFIMFYQENLLEHLMERTFLTTVSEACIQFLFVIGSFNLVEEGTPKLKDARL